MFESVKTAHTLSTSQWSSRILIVAQHIPDLLLHSLDLLKQLGVNDECLLESILDVKLLLFPHQSVPLVILRLLIYQF